jgi:catalase
MPNARTQALNVPKEPGEQQIGLRLGQLIEGIEPPDDPLIGVRDGAYAVSLSRRNP